MNGQASFHVRLWCSLILISSFGCVAHRTVRIESTPAEANLDYNGVPFGSTPRTFELRFESENDLNTTHHVHLTAENHEPFDAHLTMDDLPLKDAVNVKYYELKKRLYTEMVVPAWEDTDHGPTFVLRTVRSYLQDIEKEPKVKSLTRITSYHPRQLVASKIDVMPDSETIVYMVPHEKQVNGQVCASELSNLWSKIALEAAITRLTDGGYTDMYPGISDGGEYVYFMSSRLRKPTLWRMYAEGKGGLTKITDSAAWDSWPSVFGNEKITFVSRLRNDAAPHIWVATAEGTLPTQLRGGKMPEWSPDGKHIAYVAPDPTTQNNKLWIMKADGSNPTQITLFADSDEQCPSWHPSGRYIVFSSNRGHDELGDPNYDIWITNVDGTGQTQLTINGSDDIFPSVAPNGKFVYLYSYRGARTEIWRLELPDEYSE